MLRCIQYSLLSVLLMALPATALAQASIGEQIKQVYEATKTAKSEQDYSKIIRQCTALSKQTEDHAERTKYLASLLSWGLNKRGELYASQAIEAVDATHAAELDELALKDFEAAVANEPNRWRAVHNRGVSYALLGYIEEAEADFSTVVKLNPKYANSWFNRGELRFESGRYTEAKADYAQVLQLNPNDIASLRGHAQCDAKLGAAGPAIRSLTKAISLAANGASGLTGVARKTTLSNLRLLRGRAYEALGNWSRAAADYRQAVDLDQKSVPAYQAAAWLMAASPSASVRNARLAVAVAERAMKLEQEQLDYVSSRTYDILGVSHATAGNLTKAAQFARLALERTESPARRAAIEQRIQLYQQGKPFRISLAPATASAPRERSR